MNVAPAIVIARMNSQRLAGKGLRKVAGKPLIQYVIDTLRKTACVGEILIATSDQCSDAPLVEFAKESGVSCVRGSLNDVAARFGKAMQATEAEAAFRVNADSPFISRQLFERAFAEHNNGVFDLVTNIFPRTFPPGVSVELIRAASFYRALTEMTDEEDREHITRHFYSNCTEFRIKNIASDEDLSSCHLAVDTPQDMRVFEAMISVMSRPHWDYEVGELATIYHRVVQQIGD